MSKKNKKVWRVNYFRPPLNPKFEPGIVDFSPGWFAQRLEVNKILWFSYSKMINNIFLEASRSYFRFDGVSVRKGSWIYQRDTPCWRHSELHRHAHMPRAIFCGHKSHQKVQEGWASEWMAWKCEALAILFFWDGGHFKPQDSISLRRPICTSDVWLSGQRREPQRNMVQPAWHQNQTFIWPRHRNCRLWKSLTPCCQKLADRYRQAVYRPFHEGSRAQPPFHTSP